MAIKLPKNHRVQKKQRKPTKTIKVTSDKALLRSFLAAALLVAISIIIVPFNIDNDDTYGISAVHNAAPTTKKGRLEQLKNELNEQSPPKFNATDYLSKRTTTTAKEQVVVEVKSDGSSSSTSSHRKIHTIVSTGCSTFQDWQSYVFFFHVLKSGQEGDITRVASGCTKENEATLKEIFKNEIEPMAPGRLHIHFTPEFANVKPGLKNFKYFNKPFGVRHWFQNGLGYPDNRQEHDDTVFILMDPDQIMLRPFTGDFTNEAELWKLSKGYKLKVEHGAPFAQMYGYGIQWLKKTNVTHVFNGQPTSVEGMEWSEAQNYYMAMGPPYISTGKDMYTILDTWASIVTRVHDNYPHLVSKWKVGGLAVRSEFCERN